MNIKKFYFIEFEDPNEPAQELHKVIITLKHPMPSLLKRVEINPELIQIINYDAPHDAKKNEPKRTVQSTPIFSFSSTPF
jgi:hypothetical protein